VHVHLAAHEVDGDVDEAAADKVETADPGGALRAAKFALCPAALKENCSVARCSLHIERKQM
jgi:hypothetical protein